MTARAPLASPTSSSSVGVMPLVPVGRWLGSLVKRWGRRPTMSTWITSARHKPTFLRHEQQQIGNLQVDLAQYKVCNEASAISLESKGQHDIDR